MNHTAVIRREPPESPSLARSAPVQSPPSRTAPRHHREPYSVTTIADTFAGIATAAMALDLPALRATIHATVDTGLKAARYDGPGGRSADTSSHPERQALNERPDPSWADLDRISHLEGRFTTAIWELATRSHSGPFPQDWRSARLGAQRLATMDAINVLDRTGLKPARWVLIAGDAIHDLEIIARRHLSGRAPTEDEKNWERTNPNDLCAWHQAIHDRHKRPRRPGSNVCETCAALVIAGQGARPPAWLLEAEVDRESKPKAWTTALSRWLDELGVVREMSA